MYKKLYSKTLYCQSVQKTNSVKMQSLKADALKQRKKLRLQFIPDHQNWTIEDWKNADQMSLHFYICMVGICSEFSISTMKSCIHPVYY